MKCTNFWHFLFHQNLGTETQRTTCLAPGSLPQTDFSITYYQCFICKKKWVVDHTAEEREWESLRDGAINLFSTRRK